MEARRRATLCIVILILLAIKATSYIGAKSFSIMKLTLEIPANQAAIFPRLKGGLPTTLPV